MTEKLIKVKEPFKRNKHTYPNVQSVVRDHLTRMDVIKWVYDSGVVLSVVKQYEEIRDDFVNAVTEKIEKGLASDGVAYWKGLRFKY